ncbi:two-component regulator propeller domain-containing protein [Hymenobacter koreensis]|uniref:Two-component regulator propeller domain-containing protein n=1 Tax=Hymenobacter koreensis TaxID=1084523 RepID=A0ABP8JF31_9BACT
MLAAVVLTNVPVYAQRTAGFGDWQLHLPTNFSLAIADAGDRLYVVSADVFYVFDKDLKTVQPLSRRDGLSDVGVSTVAYDSVSRQVVVGYRSGTIDILRANGRLVTSIFDIQRKPLQGSKAISAVHFSGRNGYVTTPIGIVVLDMQRLEIRDTYVNIGPQGTVPRVYATAVLGDSLYATSDIGILSGRIGTNLLDFRQWRLRAGLRAVPLELHTRQLFAGVGGSLFTNTGNGRWTRVNYNGSNIRSLRTSAAGLLVTEPSRVTVLAGGSGVVRNQLQSALVTNAFDAVRARSGPVYVADAAKGVVEINLRDQSAESYAANAPATAQVFGLLASGGKVNVFPGGYNGAYEQSDNRRGFFEYDENGRWTNYDPITLPTQFPNVDDLVRGARTPDGTLYVASYGDGLVEWKGPGEFRTFAEGTPGTPLLNSASLPRFTRITDVASDAEGNVWVTNRHQFAGRSGLFVFNPATTQWRSVPYFTGSESLGRIVIDDSNHAWVVSDRRSGVSRVTVADGNGQTRSFSNGEGLPSNTFYAIAKDREGRIWVATEAGVAVYDDPATVFTAPESFRKPLVVRGAGTGFDLLSTDVVTAIAIDGANRKWFGTNNGLWLFNANGDESLQHFTTANSPLPSNRILDVSVNDRTGEVWVGTDVGVVAYRGSATVTEGKPECAKVFPNPVRRDFAGQVGISGIANNAEVKITDVTGTLVYQTRATGGTVVWNLADYNGRKVQSGVYLVLTSDAQGENGCIAKVAVVNGR